MAIVRNRQIKHTLEKVQSLLTNAEVLRNQYGLQEATRPLHHLALERSAPSAFSRAFQRTKDFWDTSLQRKSRFTAKLLWSISDNAKFEKLVDHLRMLINNLAGLTEDVGISSSQRLIVEYEMEIIGDEASLEAISAAGIGEDEDAVSSAARHQLEHVKERTAVSRRLLRPDDSISIATTEKLAQPTEDFESFDEYDGPQEIGIKRVSHADWRKVKPRAGILPWLPTLIVSEEPVAGVATSSNEKQTTLTRIAVNSSLLLGAVRNTTKAPLSSEHNVIMAPFKPLIYGREALITLLQGLRETTASQSTFGPQDKIHGAPKLATADSLNTSFKQKDLRLRDELECLMSLMETSLSRFVGTNFRDYSQVLFSELWLIFRPGTIALRRNDKTNRSYFVMVESTTGGRRLLDGPRPDNDQDHAPWDRTLDGIPFSNLCMSVAQLDCDGTFVHRHSILLHWVPFSGYIDLGPTQSSGRGRPLLLPVTEAHNDLLRRRQDMGRSLLRCFANPRFFYKGAVLPAYDGFYDTVEPCALCRSRYSEVSIEGHVIIDTVGTQKVLAETGCKCKIAAKWDIDLLFGLGNQRRTSEVFEMVRCADLFCDKCTDVCDDIYVDMAFTRSLVQQNASFHTIKSVESMLDEDDTSYWKGYELLVDRVCGYSLKDRQWYPLDPSMLQAIEPQSDALADVWLPDQNKQMLKAFVHSQLGQGKAQTRRNEKVISKAFIMLFHGGPGTGKSMTAAAIGASFGSPILEVHVAKLGSTVGEISRSLADLMRLAQQWSLMLVVDGADLLLGRNGSEWGFAKGSLISQMEGFNGCLILITNRMGEFQRDVLSRVDYALHFTPLNKEAQRSIWRSNIRDVQKQDVMVQEDDIMEFANQLAGRRRKFLQEGGLNGFQIRNLFGSALALARYDKDTRVDGGSDNDPVVLKRTHLVHSHSAVSDYDDYLEEQSIGKNMQW